MWGRVRRKVSLYGHQVLAPHSLNIQQMILLMELADHKSLSAKELSEKTSTDPASTSRSLEAMKKMGWIIRKTDSKDARKSLVMLSSKGQDLCSKVRSLHNKVANHIFKNLSLAEMKAFERVLEKVEEQADEVLRKNDQIT